MYFKFESGGATHSSSTFLVCQFENITHLCFDDRELWDMPPLARTKVPIRCGGWSLDGAFVAVAGEQEEVNEGKGYVSSRGMRATLLFLLLLTRIAPAAVLTFFIIGCGP